MGGAAAESLYALLAFWGLSAALARYPVILPAAKVAGAGLLMVLGLVMLLARTRGATPRTQPGRRRRQAQLRSGLPASLPSIRPSSSPGPPPWRAERHRAAGHGPGPGAALRGGGLRGHHRLVPTLLWLVGKWRSRVSAGSLGRFMRGMGAVLVAAGGWMAVRPWAAAEAVI